MDKEDRIREKVEETLGLIDRLESPGAGPYFYTRLEAELRSREKESRGWLRGQSAAGRLRAVFVTLLLLINVVSFVLFLAKPKTVPAGKAGYDEYGEYASVLLEEYSLKKNTYDVDAVAKMTVEEGQ